MSYNGIGLASVRGTATSGHVQGNRSYVKPSRIRQATERNSEGVNRQQDQMNLLQAKLGRNDDIVEHQKLRQVEMMLLEYRENLERRRVKEGRGWGGGGLRRAKGGRRSESGDIDGPNTYTRIHTYWLSPRRSSNRRRRLRSLWTRSATG